jgi:dihydrofolate synthase/folylpolyglutamate synthase
MSKPTYAEVESSLYQLESGRGMDFRLERVARVLDQLGRPQDRFPILHVAGTNGKGSVAAMLHAIFTNAGCQVALYTSPHLIRLTERIRVAANEISPTAFVEAFQRVDRAAERVRVVLTFFEYVTAMAFVYFASCEPDLAVVEVGLGGRLDATNVATPVVSVITTIGLDHEEYLGDTIEAIAREKAGIIKRARPVVLGRLREDAAAVIRAYAADLEAPVCACGRDFTLGPEAPLRFCGMGREIDGIQLGLRGEFQRDNAATAIAVALVQRACPQPGDEAIRRGLAMVEWPGRLEVVGTAPLLVLDGAHNADGAHALAAEIGRLAAGRKVHLVFAVMRDKTWPAMVRALGPVVGAVVVTCVRPPRGEDPERVARAFAPYAPVTIGGEPLATVDRLRSTVGKDEVIVVAGSLFLVGAVREGLLHAAGRHDVVPSDRVILQP